MFYSIFMSTELSPGWAELIWTVRIANVLRSCYLFYYSFFLFLFVCSALFHPFGMVDDVRCALASSWCRHWLWRKKWVVPIARSRARALNKTTTTRATAAIAEKSQEISNYLLNGRPRHIDSERERQRVANRQPTYTVTDHTHTLTH